MMNESDSVPAQEQEIKHLPMHEEWEIKSNDWLPNDQYPKDKLQLKLREAINPYSERFDALLKNIANSWITDRDELDNYRVSFEEALINAIKYGNGDAKIRTAHVEIKMDAYKLVITVLDNNTQPFDYKTTLEEASKPENLLLDHGRGLVMMNAYFDGNVTVDHISLEIGDKKIEGNQVIMTKLRSKE